MAGNGRWGGMGSEAMKEGDLFITMRARTHLLLGLTVAEAVTKAEREWQESQDQDRVIREELARRREA